jgi:hypothetical protein
VPTAAELFGGTSLHPLSWAKNGLGLVMAQHGLHTGLHAGLHTGLHTGLHLIGLQHFVS